MKKSDAFIPIMALQLGIWLGGCSSTTAPNAAPQPSAGTNGAPVPVPKAAPSSTASSTVPESAKATTHAPTPAEGSKIPTAAAPPLSGTSATAYDAPKKTEDHQTAAASVEKAPVKLANVAEIPKLLDKAHSLYKNKNPKVADAIVDSVLAADPTNVAALRLRSRMTVLTDAQKAADDLSTVISLDPTAEDYSNRAFAYCCLNKPQDGMYDCLTAIKIDPDLAEAHHNLAWSYNGQKKFQSAIDEENEAMKLNMKEAWNYNDRAWAYKDLGKTREALADFAIAIQKSPDYMQAYLGRYQLYKKLGNATLAATDLQKAKQLGYVEPPAEPAKSRVKAKDALSKDAATKPSSG